jgi:hypothetical protein
MGIKIVWGDEEKTIIHHVYEGNWMIEDYYNLISEHNRILNNLDYPIAVVNDLRLSGPIPAGIGSAVKYAARKAPQNEEIKIMVGGDRSIKTLIDLINMTAGTDVTELIYVATLEEAYTVIAENRKRKAAPGALSREQPVHRTTE